MGILYICVMDTEILIKNVVQCIYNVRGVCRKGTLRPYIKELWL